MKVHHLNCATMRPVGGFGGRFIPPEVVAHVLLLERDNGLALVDTGFGTEDIAAPKRLGRPFVTAMRPALDRAETALAQVEALGFAAEDVRDVVLTHLDLDHAGGLGDFPEARVHVDRDELDAARHPKAAERARYVAAQWAHGPDFVEHAPLGDPWFGFTGVQALGDDVLLVPLRGHTRGHCGVAVREDDGSWLLHAGDSYFWHGEVDTPPTYQRGLLLFQKLMSRDEKARQHNQERLRELRATHGDEITVFSAHDKAELDRLA